jgi:8-hydroxy-5-deazaflavin:NADPH oxidoreductase
MKVGILGSGDVAKALGSGFLGRGDDVMLGTRDPIKLAQWLDENPKARVGSLAETAAFGETIVLATLGSAMESVIDQAGASAFEDKVVIDATNPLGRNAGGPYLTIGLNDSLGERVQRALPRARVVKAFNIVGSAHMVHPKFENGPPSMLIAGNDDAAKQSVTEVLHDFGWDVADLGGIESARYLEPMCMAWVVYGMRSGGWHHAFKLLR